MREDRVIKIAFIISLVVHCLFLGMPRFDLTKPKTKRDEEINVKIEIEKPPLLPKIDIIDVEKKLKKIERKEKSPELVSKPKPEPQPEEEKTVKESDSQPKEQIELDPEPEPQKEKIVKKREPERKIEERKIKENQPEPHQEFIEVINPQKEAMLRYQDIIKQRIESCRRYPNWAKKQGFEGISYLKFTILSTGFVKDIKIIRSSGFDILDKEAISTVKRAQPFPPIPEEMKVPFLTMEVSIVFTLQ